MRSLYRCQPLHFGFHGNPAASNVAARQVTEAHVIGECVVVGKRADEQACDVWRLSWGFESNLSEHVKVQQEHGWYKQHLCLYFYIHILGVLLLGGCNSCL